MQILPLDAGAHGLMGGTLSLLTRQPGVTLAYTEGIRLGEMVEDPAEVRALARSYDVLTAWGTGEPLSLARAAGAGLVVGPASVPGHVVGGWRKSVRGASGG
ncbi:Scr1 family TA system antitoxin-like transcriptional regulator [Streptomyces uncialis]|uniref:Scr1 family TA system antitoxin-like transcriptional regulator n=1 Tax=Streptomyces uncialis TaxID=1048205 RepID=UPI00364A2DF8